MIYTGGDMSVIIGEKGSLYFHRADTFEDYIRYIEKLNTNSKLYFRGFSTASYDMSPSIGRIIEGKSKWLFKESRLVEFAEQNNPGLFAQTYPTQIISNMQHYGIPTRMMDISGNAFVALFFACVNEDKYGVDGKVVVFEGMPVSAYNPFANILADSYRLIGETGIDIDTYMYLIEKQQYASTIFRPDWKSNNDLKNRIIDIHKKPMIVDVGVINLRQRNQDGKFLLFPNQINGDNVSNELITINKTDDIVKAEIIISKDEKARIKKLLKLVGITESFIYPDDVEKALAMLKNELLS